MASVREAVVREEGEVETGSLDELTIRGSLSLIILTYYENGRCKDLYNLPNLFRYGCEYNKLLQGNNEIIFPQT